MKLAFLFTTLGVFCGGVARAQIGPGPLSRAHADLEGVTRCSACHDFGARRLKCLGCHVEIKGRVESGRGYHARAYRTSAGETDCARCHAEHRGPKFALVALDRNRFDHHAQTGFKLEGKHRMQQCESCHAAAKISAAARAEIKMRNLDRSFLGLRRECNACHNEPHRRQLGTDCQGCHIQEAWKPAPKFSHSRASFVLTGQHQRVACDKCHKPADRVETTTEQAPEPPGSSRVQKEVLFKGLEFSSCQGCHIDRHRGAFQASQPGSRCEACHDTAGWKNNRPGKGFDHNLAKFRPAGRHADLTCAKCHKDADFGRPIAHTLCRDCHEDAHRGQFAMRAGGSDCSACHRESGFKPSLFDREAHQRSAFPLEGKHSAPACGKCHQPEGREARYRTGNLQCAACHQDPHGGEFSGEPYGNRCDLCHTQGGFAATTFTVDRHSKTRFALAPPHAAVACGKCHKPLVPGAPGAGPDVTETSGPGPARVQVAQGVAQNARRRYRFASLACAVCHADPHAFNPRTDLSCENCHALREWKTPLPFDHSRTRFRLDRSHGDPTRPIACVRCHRTPAAVDGVAARTAPAFSGTSTECSACHGEKDAHGGQFGVGIRQRDCSSCHSVEAWKTAGFDHDSARFALDVAHRRVECTKCHKEQKPFGGRLVRIYRGTPVECLRCH